MRLPNKGDIWLVHCPYSTPGNMEKVRPAIILDIYEEENMIKIQKLSTKYHKGSKLFEHPKLKRTTYLSKEVFTIEEYNLIRYIGTIKQMKRKKL